MILIVYVYFTKIIEPKMVEWRLKRSATRLLDFADGFRFVNPWFILSHPMFLHADFACQSLSLSCKFALANLQTVGDPLQSLENVIYDGKLSVRSEHEPIGNPFKGFFGTNYCIELTI